MKIIDKLFKNKRKLSKLEKSELILDYTHNFSSKYMLYEGLTEWIKKIEPKDRMWYIINSCNIKNPTKQEQFLLALAYCNLGQLYTDYAIYYLKLYLGNDNFYSNDFYYKQFPGCNTNLENRNFQLNFLCLKLSKKYLDNLEYDNALKYSFITKSFYNFDNHYQQILEPYSIISEILYKQNNIKGAITNIKEAILKTKDKYNKKSYIELLEKYEKYKEKNQLFKIRNIKRPRLKLNSNIIYDLTTGETLN